MNRAKKTQIYRRYADAASKVSRYMIESDSITVQFKDNTAYRWTNQSCEPANVAKMKELALAGKGLDAFIEKNVACRYLRKVR